MKDSIKSKSKLKSTVIRSVLSEINYIEKEKNSTLDISSILLKGITRRQDSIQQYLQGGRQDLADVEISEIKVLEEYLPRKLNEGEIKEKIQELISSVGAKSVKDSGIVMKAVKMDESLSSTSPKVIMDIIKQVLAV